MPVTNQQRELILQTLRNRFPSWNSFDDADFVAEEIAYKQAAVQKAQTLLGQETLQKLLVAGDYDEIIQNLDKIGNSTNLLYLSTPHTGDLNILFYEGLNKASFSQAIFSLLWDEDTSPNRFKHYLDYVVQNDLPNKWTFPTYFLFFCHPESELFIKPEGVIRPFLKLIGSQVVLPDKPDADSYAAILQLAQEIKEALAEYDPRNFVHIQSLMWVCAKEKPVPPNNVIPPITPQTRFWKIAPGENAHLWNRCRSGNYMAIGWPSLGDVRTIPRAEFEDRREIAIDEDSDVTRDGVEQLWKFTHDIKPGDRIVANQGFSKVVGIGVVIGPCDFEENGHYRHRLPVHWYDPTTRQVQQGGWVRTLVELRREQFESISTATPLVEESCWKFAPYSTCWNWEMCKSEGVMALGYDALGDISGLHPKEFRKKRDEVSNEDARFAKADLEAVWQLTQVPHGAKVAAIERDTGRVLGWGEVNGIYSYAVDAPQFRHRVPVQWHSVTENHNDSAARRKTLEDISADVFKTLTGEEFVNPSLKTITIPTPETVTPMPSPLKPLNQILYGPPGTGKTYSIIERAVEIIDSQKPVSHQAAKARFDELAKQGRISFITFHQSYSYEDFVEGIRPVFDKSGGGSARYEVRDGIFKQIALNALGRCLKPDGLGQVTFDSVWNALEQQIELDPNQQYEGLSDKSRYSFVLLETGVEGKNVLSDSINSFFFCSRADAEQVWTSYHTALRVNSTDVKKVVRSVVGHSAFIATIVNELKRLAAGNYFGTTDLVQPQRTAQSFLNTGQGYTVIENGERYVLIIDEINRGNISKILGELITLLEDDKRLGAENGLKVTLPYSGDIFAVPHNLYILGTMNTADKSLALVDVALRRRFKFKELAPDFAVCTGLTAEMRKLLDELNTRITLRKDREHRIGHAYFARVSNEAGFNEVFETQVIPLLQEYFYNDWEGLRYVLGESKRQEGFIVALPNSKSAEARNKWQWLFDAVTYSPPSSGSALDCLKFLRANYGPGVTAGTVVQSSGSIPGGVQDNSGVNSTTSYASEDSASGGRVSEGSDGTGN